jgi:hypothetical protein
MARTYVRRRFVAITILVMFVLGGTAARGLGAPAGGTSSLYVVRSGDTLWGIAVRSGSLGADPRPMIDQIQKLNHLPDAGIRPGQTLILPAGSS